MSTNARIATREGSTEDAALNQQTNPSLPNHGSCPHANPFRELPVTFFNRISKEVDLKVREISQDVNNPYKETNLTDSEIKADFFVMFASACQEHFESSGDLNPLERAIMCYRQAISLLGEGNEIKPGLLGVLASLLRDRSERLGELDDVNESIQCCTQAIQLTPEGHPIRLNYLNDLALAWLGRYQQLGEQTALKNAFKYQIPVVELAPDNHPRKPAFLNNLGNLWISQFERCGEREDLHKAIQYQTQAVQLTSGDSQDRAALLNNLATSRLRRFSREGDLTDIHKVIEDQAQAIKLVPDGDPHRPACLNNLALALHHRFERLGDLSDLEKAIEYESQAVQLTAEGHFNKPNYLERLGVFYLRRFEQLGKLVDVKEAVRLHEQALRLTPEKHKHEPTRLISLGEALWRRAQRLGDLADLEKAIKYELQAISLIPEDHDEKPGFLISLGNSYWYRFERSGKLSDVDEAIKCHEQALQLISKGNSGESIVLNNLGCSLLRRFERMGDLADVDKAIKYQSQAIQVAPKDDIRKLSYFSNLGNAWRRRFQRLGEQVDIDNAIKYQTQAVQLTPEDNIAKPEYLINLGCSWSSRFERLRQPEDIDKAIKYQSRAVELTPDDHANKQMYLNSLGYSWVRRFLKFGEPSDVDQAIECQTRAVQLTPKGHPDKARNLNNLGNSFKCRYNHLGNLADLDKSIEYHAQAVELTPEGHASKPKHLVNLGNSWVRRYELLGEHADLESALVYFKQGAGLIITDPETQIDCARKWATNSILLGLSPLEGYQRSFALIPHLAWVGLTIKGRYSTLIKISDLTAEAAAWAVSIECYDLAIEWLEEGRSIVWNQILQLRAPFDDLAVIDPQLANRLKVTATQLEVAGSRTAAIESDTEFQLDLEHQAQHHRYLAAQWEELLIEARQLPGFHDFMQPRKIQELRKAASDGPIVVINAHASRCDALIILPEHEDVVHVPLDRFTHTKAVECRSRISSMIGRRRSGNEARGCELDLEPENDFQSLVILWSDLVSPVLEALACTDKLPYSELPHITWCATGALSFLPLHAAGMYDGISPNAIDLTVSSYTPTLSALIPQSSTHSVDIHAGVLAVGQANLHGFSPLPKTAEELAIIKNHAKSFPFQQLDGPLATVEATLTATEAHSWVHLACHAIQNRFNPSHSAFHLHDGELTLETITKRAFKNKGLAFLSACQTATGDSSLPDESTHLAAGMLMAGYPSVIATMWSIMDDDAPNIAEGVYGELMRDGKMDRTNSARALHKAVSKLRDKVGMTSIGRWAPFIHIGA